MTRAARSRATAALSVAPATVSDRTAPLVLGLEPRVYRELLVRQRIRHARIGRRVVARTEDVLAALDQMATTGPKTRERVVGADDDEPGDLATVDDVLRQLGRRRAE